MPGPVSQHPFLDLFAASLAPWMQRGPGHDKDPPPLRQPLPGFMQPDLRALLDLFVAADQDLREDRFNAAARNLDVAETRIRLAISHDGSAASAYEAVLGDIALARQAAERRDSAHGCGAVADAVRALAASQRRP
jgi:hypothetical protein